MTSKKSKIKVLTKKEEYFIQCLFETNNKTEAYKMMHEKFKPNEPLPTPEALQSSGSRVASRLESEIEERKKNNFYAQKEKALDTIIATIEKREEVQKKIGVGELAYNDDAVNDLNTIAKSPILLGELMRAGALNLLYDEVELKVVNGKKVIKKAIPNEYNWLKYEKLTLALIQATDLSKEMFKYASEKEGKNAPTVANQVNVNINK